MNLLALAVSSFVLAPLIGLIGSWSSPLVAVVPALLFVAFCTFVPETAAGGLVLEAHAWIPSLGIQGAFRLDGLSLLFALLITGIGAVVFLYASSYMRGHDRLTRFYTVLALFMGSMIGAVLADDLLLLIVFWEMTSITSFLLIGYAPEQAEARRSAQQGLLVTVGGGLALLAGAILIGSAAGTYSITEILERGELVAAHPLAPVIIVLTVTGALAKSAQAPLHSWLANAMVAPTPVSAYLHSATMVKLGVHLLARFDPVFGNNPLWIALLTAFGTATMLAGAILAMRETDLKRILAYSTIVSLGMLTMLIGIPSELAAIAAATFLVVHALYKACLFLVVGIIDHQTGLRDGSVIRGLHRTMPVTNFAALLGGLAMAGLPPFIGFIAKELVYELTLDASGWLFVTTVALLANATMVVVASIIAVRCFTGYSVLTAKEPTDPGFTMLGGPALLGILGLFFGISPWILADTLILPAASAIAGRPVIHTLSHWHGVTPMLILSVLSLALGVAAFRCWDGLRTLLASAWQIDRWGPDRGYDRAMELLPRLARWQTDLIQTGSLRNYLGRVLGIFAAAALATLFLRGGLTEPPFAQPISPDVVLVVFLIVAALAVLRARNFVSGIVAAGMVGFSVALVFLFQGAPDLAFTQFSVEALAIVVLLAIVGRLPFREQDYRTKRERMRDGGVAAAIGLVVALVLLSVLSQPFDDRVSEFFRNTSAAEAHGRNVVNVLIVDFRALDTLGEISVLGLAAIAAAAVITGVRLRTSEKRS